ncbi:MAG: hypothetical protein KKC78_10875 [Proteobacteria bacterium]|nr:hypothetical protein [Pseudomonadota bacterium]
MREPISRLFFAHLNNGANELLDKYHKIVSAWVDFTRPAWIDKESEVSPPVITCLMASHDNLKASASCRSEDGNITILMDGYLTNQDELIALLPADCRGVGEGGDAQLLLSLYAHFGENYLKYLNGWFAVIVIDKRQHKVLVGIDRFGMYPLYIYKNNNGLFLTSDIHMLFHMNIAPASLDMKGISDYWVYGGVLENRSLFENIFRVPPATLWSFDSGGGNNKTYFNFDSLGDKGPIIEVDQAVRAVTQLMTGLVPRYFESSGGKNFFLSGGWDTRIIASYINDEAKRGTRCVTYGCDRKSIDHYLANKIAVHLGCDHQFIQMDQAFLDNFPSLAFDAIYLTDGFGSVQNAISLFILDSVDRPTSSTVTGKFGSEFVRGAEGVLGNHDLAMINPELRGFIQKQTIDPRPNGWFGDKTLPYQEHLMRRLDECRSVWAGNQLAERYKTWTMSPYLDNEMVDMMFRMPGVLRQGDTLLHCLVLHDPKLSAMPTNRGEFAGKHGILDSIVGWSYHSLWYLSLVANSTKLPPWMKADLLPFPTQRISKWKTWYRENFQPFIKEILLDPSATRRNLFDANQVQRALANDLGQMRNLNILNRMLSIELVHRLFID